MSSIYRNGQFYGQTSNPINDAETSLVKTWSSEFIAKFVGDNVDAIVEEIDSLEYSGLAPEVQNNGTVYFITDRGVIYHNGIEYGEKIRDYNSLNNIPLSIEDGEVKVSENYISFFESIGIEAKEMTSEEYNNLLPEEKEDEGTIYFINDGQLSSEGINLENYYTKEEVNSLIPTDFYTKEEVNNLIPTDFYTKEETDALIPTDFYTKEEVNDLVDCKLLTYSIEERTTGQLKIVFPYTEYNLFSLSFFVQPTNASSSGPPLVDYNLGQTLYTQNHLYYLGRSSVDNNTRILAYSPSKANTFMIPITASHADNEVTFTISMAAISEHLPENMRTFYAYVACYNKKGGS